MFMSVELNGKLRFRSGYFGVSYYTVSHHRVLVTQNINEHNDLLLQLLQNTVLLPLFRLSSNLAVFQRITKGSECLKKMKVFVGK